MVTFQGNAPCTCAFCTFWGIGITPKTPSGRHASFGTTQQSLRVALNCTAMLKVTLIILMLSFYFSTSRIEFFSGNFLASSEKNVVKH